MEIWTARVAYNGADRLDITIKNAVMGSIGWLFAPSWELVGGHKLYTAISTNKAEEIARWKKYQPLDNDQYTERYYEIVRAKYREHQALFVKLLDQDRTLCCFCKSGAFCHRHLA